MPGVRPVSSRAEPPEDSRHDEPSDRGGPTAPDPLPSKPSRPAAGLGIFLAFLASAAVLTLELLSLRLVAPYVGLTIQANSAVIGMALGGIAAGARLGGELPGPREPPHPLGPPFLLARGGGPPPRPPGGPPGGAGGGGGPPPA